MSLITKILIVNKAYSRIPNYQRSVINIFLIDKKKNNNNVERL